jgi:enoyl-CoA hydratase
VSNYQSIRYETERNRARITLNRPEKLNAITDAMQGEIADALWRADDDSSVHSIIVRGAGRAFSSGYDLNAYADHATRPRGEQRGGDNFDDDAWHLERSQYHLRAFSDVHKPVIAQVHGYCLAGATGIALCCDMVIAADDAVIGFPAGRAGTLPNQMWLYHVGPQWTKRLLLTGDTITGSEAAGLGLVMKSVPADLLDAEVEGLADRFALVDTDVLSAGKRIVNLGLELMGAGTLQRLAAEMDVRAHLSEAARKLFGVITEDGVKAAVTQRDGRFGDGRARVREPELRDEHGHLLDA